MEYEIQKCFGELPLPLSPNHEIKQAAANTIFYVVHNGEVIAYISVQNVEGAGKIVFVNIPAFSVDRNFQGQGIGTDLLNFALSNIDQEIIYAYPNDESDVAKQMIKEISQMDSRICIDENSLKQKLGKI